MPWESHKAGQSSAMPAATILSNKESESDALYDGPVIERVGSGIYVDKVVDRAKTSRTTRELADHYPFVVQNAYTAEFVKEWRQPALTSFDAVYQVLEQDIERLVDNHFGKMGREDAK